MKPNTLVFDEDTREFYPDNLNPDDHEWARTPDCKFQGRRVSVAWKRGGKYTRWYRDDAVDFPPHELWSRLSWPEFRQFFSISPETLQKLQKGLMITCIAVSAIMMFLLVFGFGGS